MYLPISFTLPIDRLAGCFVNTTASYKFYWFLSLIQSIEHGKRKISRRELYARMVANAWYSVNYFKLSLGKQDSLSKIIENIRDTEGVDQKEEIDKIISKLTSNDIENTTIRQLETLGNNVPYYFLSPWVGSGKTIKEFISASQSFDNQCPYAIFDTHILINDDWFDYIFQHSGILKDFCHWNLSLYLQSKNPNTPAITEKLNFNPNDKRNQLTKQKSDFWNIAINQLSSINCIYTHQPLSIGKYALDHFIPHSFVSHDLIWNLIPADPSFNSKKSNKIPDLNIYFDSFFDLQIKAYKIVLNLNTKNRFLEDYLTIFPDLDFHNLEEPNYDAFRNTMQPLVTIARNNGFQSL